MNRQHVFKTIYHNSDGEYELQSWLCYSMSSSRHNFFSAIECCKLLCEGKKKITCFASQPWHCARSVRSKQIERPQLRHHGNDEHAQRVMQSQPVMHSPSLLIDGDISDKWHWGSIPCFMTPSTLPVNPKYDSDFLNSNYIAGIMTEP